MDHPTVERGMRHHALQRAGEAEEAGAAPCSVGGGIA